MRYLALAAITFFLIGPFRASAQAPDAIIASGRIPMCKDYLNAYTGGAADPWMIYAQKLFLKFDEQRVANGQQSVGARLDDPKGFESLFAQWCQAWPAINGPFEQVVMQEYQLQGTMMHPFGR